MIKYGVYYRKEPHFHVDKSLTKSDVPGKLFAWITTVEVKSKDYIYSMFQGEQMDPSIKLRLKNLRESMEIPLHTSMSVGDCVKNTRTGTIYQCAPVGWEKVK
jgi:hypothetical protein